MERTSEQSVIGAILRNPELLDEMPDSFDANVFEAPENRALFQVIFDVLRDSQTATQVLVLEEARRRTPNMISDIQDAWINAVEYPTYDFHQDIRVMLENHKINQVSLGLSNMALSVRSGAMDPETALIDVQSLGENMDISDSLTTLKDALESEVVRFREVAEGRQDIGMDPGMWGLGSYFKLHAGTLVTIFARPGLGKSLLLLQMAMQSSEEGSSLFFSMEMDNSQIATRVLSGRHGMNLSTKPPTIEDVTQLETKPTESDCNIIMSTTYNLTVEKLSAIATRAVKKHNVKRIFIDYLQLIKGSGGETREQEVATIMRELKFLAARLGVPIILAAQQNRGTESRKKEDKRPMLSDVRESGSIENDSHVVMGLWKPDGDRNDVHELVILKNRNGPVGELQMVLDRTHLQYQPMRTAI